MTVGGIWSETVIVKQLTRFNNLRLKRNSIVHSDKTEVELSLEDLQYLIDYICKMG